MKNEIIIDASAVIAVLTSEPTRKRLVQLTLGRTLAAPSCLDWEIGNAFSAMFKRKKLDFKQAVKALNLMSKLPIRRLPVDIADALKVASDHSIYAYDAYYLVTSSKLKSPLLTLDKKLMTVARSMKIGLIGE